MSEESYNAKVTFSRAYADMVVSRNNFKTAQSQYRLDYHAFLQGILSRCGVLNKIVLIRNRGNDLMGEFRVEEDCCSSKPYVIKFHPLTKSGEVSSRSKYLSDFYPWEEHTLEEQIRNLVVEVVRDA